MNKTPGNREAVDKYRKSEKGLKASADYREQHRDDSRAYQKQYYKDHSRKKMNSLFLRIYKISVDTYDAMLLSQGNRCKICGVHQSELDRALCVDHNHETGEVRGLLCKRCNSALGYFNESSELLIRAAEYLGGY